MAKYAENTIVDSGRSRAEIEKILIRYGADQFMYGWEEAAARIAFRFDGRSVKFLLPLPNREEFARTEVKRAWRSEEAQTNAYEQAVRQRWRALALCIKAKLEAVEAGIVTFDDEFLAHFVLPGGQTIGERWGEEYRTMIASGDVPKLLEDSRATIAAATKRIEP